MISAWNLLWVIPVAGAIGALAIALVSANKRIEHEINKQVWSELLFDDEME